MIIITADTIVFSNHTKLCLTTAHAAGHSPCFPRILQMQRQTFS